MKADILKQLVADQAARRAVALTTELASGAQALVYPVEKSGPEGIADAFRYDRSGIVETSGGEVFINVFNPALRLVIIGAVHVTQALAPMARHAGYDVVIIDPRAAFASDERFPHAKLMRDWPDEALDQLGLDPRCAVLALTHDPKIDDPALTAALNSECFYIGALGSKKTHAGRRDRLLAEGFGEAALKRIHGPIGLDIGARGPAEIAVSILAEMVGVLRKGAGDG